MSDAATADGAKHVVYSTLRSAHSSFSRKIKRGLEHNLETLSALHGERAKMV